MKFLFSRMDWWILNYGDDRTSSRKYIYIRKICASLRIALHIASLAFCVRPFAICSSIPRAPRCLFIRSSLYP